MDPTVASSAKLLIMGDRLFSRALDDVTEDQALLRPDGKANSMIWIAAHLTTSRNHLGTLIGMERPPLWGDLFDRGTEPGDTSPYPSVEEINSTWNATHADLIPWIEKMTEADLATEVSIKFPNRDQTRRGAISFIAFHEGYHFGQLSYARKLLGLSGLAR